MPAGRRGFAERRHRVGTGRGVRVDWPERGEPHRLHLDEPAALPLDEVNRVVVRRVTGAPWKQGARKQRRDRERYKVQPVLLARQRRVQRSTGSITSLSIATITTSITKPHAIMPVKLPASYQ